jgi:hypothetical protein
MEPAPADLREFADVASTAPLAMKLREADLFGTALY